MEFTNLDLFPQSVENTNILILMLRTFWTNFFRYKNSGGVIWAI